MDDLFGSVPQRAVPAPGGAAEQQDDAQARFRAARTEYYGSPVVDMPVPRGGHTADSIRPILQAIVAEAQATPRMTWTPQKLRHYTALVPYMAEWLKNGEGDGLLQAFKAEMDRLDAPVDQVAPNWRRIWGLAA